MNPIHLRELPDKIPQQPLTVGDLIQLLNRVDPTLPVLIEDYESGVTTMFRISQSEIVRDPDFVPGITGEYAETGIDSEGDLVPYRAGVNPD